MTRLIFIHSLMTDVKTGTLLFFAYIAVRGINLNPVTDEVIFSLLEQRHRYEVKQIT